MSNEVLAVDVVEAGRRLGVSTRTITNLLARKELKGRKVGRRRVISVAELEAFLRNDQERKNRTSESAGVVHAEV